MQALVEDLSAMNTAKKTHIQPGAFIVPDPRKDDSLGTTDVADSTGNDPENETGDAKTGNHNTCEN